MLSLLRFPMSFGIGPCIFGFEDNVLCETLVKVSLGFQASFEKHHKQLQKVCELHV